jgi:probable phosphoglycerate mutase
MEILFARHGNTFDPGAKVVWVGRESDLPLVARGLAQAAELGRALGRCALVPDVIYAAGLQRTQRFAQIVAETLDLAEPVVDRRLDEVDYGRWAGRSNDEIADDGPAALAAMEAWNGRDVWPPEGFWNSGQAETLGALAAFAAERLVGGGHRRPLVVSSNGILRFLPRLLLSVGAHRAGFKMRTGHVGIIERGATAARLRCWDVPPEQLEGH